MSKRKATGGSQETAVRLLDVAEQLFSERGYEATTVRDIAIVAGVNQALIHCHFKNKLGLFESVFERRGHILAHERMRLLEEERRKAGKGAISLRRILYAFVYPPLSMSGQSEGGRAFVKLQARLHSEPKELEGRLRERYYDHVTLAFVDELKRALPDTPASSIHWRLLFVMGLYQYVALDTGRLEVISRGNDKGSDFTRALTQILDFAEKGFLADTTAP